MFSPETLDLSKQLTERDTKTDEDLKSDSGITDVLKAISDATKLMNNIKQDIKINNISLPYQVFEDSEEKQYIFLGLQNFNDEELNALVNRAMLLPSRYTENRYYLDTKKVVQYEFNINLSYMYCVALELHEDFVCNYKRSMTNDTINMSPQDLQEISSQIDYLNKNIPGIKIQSSLYSYTLDKFYVEKRNKDNSRRELFEIIDLRGKSSKEIKDIINNLSNDTTVFEHRDGDDVPHDHHFMPLSDNRKELLLKRIEEISKAQFNKK